MAHEHDSLREEVQEIRELIERIAKRHGHESPLPTGYILMATYLDDEGDATWAIRTDPDSGSPALLGMATMLHRQLQEAVIREMEPFVDEDDEP